MIVLNIDEPEFGCRDCQLRCGNRCFVTSKEATMFDPIRPDWCPIIPTTKIEKIDENIKNVIEEKSQLDETDVDELGDIIDQSIKVFKSLL